MERRHRSTDTSLVLPELYARSSRIASLALSWPSEELLPTQPIEALTLQPRSFEDIYRNRHALQRGLIKLVRTNDVWKQYKDEMSNPAFYQASYVQDRIMRGRDIALVFNKYPYNLPPDTSHLNLWVGKKYKDDLPEIISYLDCQLQRMGLSGEEDIVIYENPTYMRSKPDDTHYHIPANIPPAEAERLLAD